MAKTQTIEIPPGQEFLQRQALEQRDRFTLSVVQAHKRPAPLSVKQRLKRQSIFSILSPFWRALTDDEKSSWSMSGAVSGLSNWQAFISENAGARRIGNPIPVTPSNFHTGNVGTIFSVSNNSNFLARQLHPQKYLAVRPVPGASWKSELVTITETFSFPLTLRIRYLLSVQSQGTNPRARYFARVTTSYQGSDIVRDYSIPLQSGSSWNVATLTITGQLGFFVGYVLFLELADYSAFLYFDNIEAVHTGTNWARDPKCNQVDRRFTRAFSLVSPYWGILNNSNIFSFSSDYFAFDS